MPSSAVAPLVAGATSALVGGLFGGGGGGSSPSQARVVPSGNFGGLTLSGGGSNLDITSGSERATAVQRSANVIGRKADELAAIRGRVQPGFGELTQARLGAIENARSRSIGNLRENLARRRLSGSSFANDALARADAEFGQAAAEAKATSLLQELDLTTQLINQEFTTRQAAIERTIQELDFQAQIGTQILSGVSAELGASARLEAQLAFDSAAGIGSFFEPFSSAIGEAAGSFASDIFSGGGNSAQFDTAEFGV